jgi:hypothetical protein
MGISQQNTLSDIRKIGIPSSSTAAITMNGRPEERKPSANEPKKRR